MKDKEILFIFYKTLKHINPLIKNFELRVKVIDGFVMCMFRSNLEYDDIIYFLTGVSIETIDKRNAYNTPVKRIKYYVSSLEDINKILGVIFIYRFFRGDITMFLSLVSFYKTNYYKMLNSRLDVDKEFAKEMRKAFNRINIEVLSDMLNNNYYMNVTATSAYSKGADCVLFQMLDKHTKETYGIKVSINEEECIISADDCAHIIQTSPFEIILGKIYWVLEKMIISISPQTHSEIESLNNPNVYEPTISDDIGELSNRRGHSSLADISWF